jgi:hypothetical protein
MQRIQPAYRTAVHKQERFPSEPKTTVNGKSRPIFRDRNIESDLNWRSKRRPGSAKPKFGPAGVMAGAKLTFGNQLAVPVTPGAQFQETD